MLRCYHADIARLPDPALRPDVLSGLPKERQGKCLGYRQPEDRKRCLGAGLIIHRVLLDHGCAPALSYGAMGKPEAEGIQFNVSHGGGFVIGVAAPCPVGCDIEPIQPPPLEIAERFFHHEELTYLHAHPDPTFAFWKLWTLKESYMKMTGEGMSLGLDQFQMVMDEPISVIREGKKVPCAFRHRVYHGHSIAICVSGPQIEDPVITEVDI